MGAPAWALTAGLLATGLTTWQQVQNNQTKTEAALSAQAAVLAAQVAERVERLQLGLTGLRAFVTSIGWKEITRERFERYAHAGDIDREFPGVRGLGVIRRVPVQEMAAHEAEAAKDQWPGYRVRQLAPHPDERWVIQYIEPVHRNRQAVGLDVASEPIRREAARQALRSASARLTAPITLVQASGQKHAGFLLLEPVFPQGALPLDPAQREQIALGWTYAPLAIREVLASLEVARSGVRLRLSDVQDGQVRPFYDSDALPEEGVNLPPEPTTAHVQPLKVAGRQWQVAVTPTPAFLNAHQGLSPWVVAAFGSGGSLLLLLAVAQLRRQRVLAAELHRAQTQRATVLHLSQDAILQCNAEGLIVDWNHGAESLLGYPVNVALGQPALDWLWPQAERASMQEQLRRARDGEPLRAIETEILARSGESIAVSAQVVVPHHEAGLQGGWALSLRDIRSAKTAESKVRELNASLENQVAERTAQLDSALRRSESLLHTVRTHAIVSIADRSGTIVEVNDNFCTVSGFARDELIGQNHRVVNSGHHDAQFWRSMWGTIARGTPWRGEICNRARDGHLYWVDSMISPLRNAEGRIEQYLSIRFDITERKNYEAQLTQASARAEAANHAKSSFLANMSHEIRSPLNAILGLGYLLEQTALDPQQRTTVDRLCKAGNQLLGQINDVLDIAKVEAGELILEQEPFCPRQVLQDLVAIHSINAQAKGLPVQLVLDPQLPEALIGDAKRLAQIGTNLLANAIKFTQEGRVVVRARWSEGPVGHLHLEVEDTGIGMDAQTLSRVFDPFVQADTSTTRRFGGTGLGLSIVKNLSQLMGGEVGARSTLGEGSVLWADLPFAPASPSALQLSWSTRATLPADCLAGLTLMVVDDVDINRDVARQILIRHGAQVQLAEDGAQAVALLTAAPGWPDLVLMDMHMPVMDGFEATRAIRQLPGGAALPILALTAGATAAERDLALAAGVTGFATKPFETQRLLVLILTLLGRPLPTPSVPGVEGSPQRPADWPQIEGVDAMEVQERFGGNRELYLRMLERLLTQPPLAWPQSREDLRQEAHRVRGVAATLGLKQLTEKARQTEALLESKPVDEAEGPWLATLATWEHLAQACAPLWAASTARPTVQGQGCPADELEALLTQLDAQQIDAVARFEQLRKALETDWGPETVELLHRLILDLRFEEAAAQLRGLAGKRLELRSGGAAPSS